MTNKSLLPCPFCGCNADIFDEHYGYVAFCIECKASSSPSAIYELTSKLWNNRVIDPVKYEKLLDYVKEQARWKYPIAPLEVIKGEATELLKELGENE